MTKLLFLIDSLEGGGAQRQLINLVNLLSLKGYKCTLAVYFQRDFFRDMVYPGVDVVPIQWGNHFSRTFRIWEFCRQFRPDVLVSFLDTPNKLAELCSFPLKAFPVVVSERNTDQEPTSYQFRLKCQLHRRADGIVCNGLPQVKLLRERAPHLGSKIIYIPNCCDLVRFFPKKSANVLSKRLLFLGRFRPQKNPGIFAEVFDLLYDDVNLRDLEVHLYSRMEPGSGDNTGKMTFVRRTLDAFEKSRGAEAIKIFPPRKDPENLYSLYDALVLPSFFEGFPNVVGEAVACGRPILLSNQVDQTLLSEGVNGFGFSPNSPQDLVAQIRRLYALNLEDYREMCRASRRIAEEELDQKRFVKRWEGALKQVVKGFRRGRLN